LTLGLPLALTPKFPLGPQPYNPFCFGREPKARVATQYIIVVIEYLTKWVEAKTVKFVDAKQMTIFLNENIISRFGCLKILISD